jgi:hypothetical protein
MSMAWQLLTGLPCWEITELLRVPPVSGSPAGNGSAPPAAYMARLLRAQALAPASRGRGAFAFGMLREKTAGPVRIIAGGPGLLRARQDGARPSGEEVPLAYPPRALGRQLPDGGAAAAFAAMPSWVPVAILADALLNPFADGTVPPGDGPAFEDGFLTGWRDPFAFLVLAVPVPRDRHEDLLTKASLAQLNAQQHDSPRAQQAARRRGARHDELRRARSSGLWEIRFQAGAASPAAAADAATLLTASLNLHGLGFGLSEQPDRAAPLPQLLGAPAGISAGPGRQPGPLTREVTTMYAGDPRGQRPRTTPTAPGTDAANAVPPASRAPGAPADSGAREETVQDSPSWTAAGTGTPVPGSGRPEADAAPARREAAEAGRLRREAAERAHREAAAAARRQSPGIPGMPWGAGDGQPGPGTSAWPGAPDAHPGPAPAGLPAEWFSSPDPRSGTGNAWAAAGPRPAWLGGDRDGPHDDGPRQQAASPLNSPLAPDFSDPEPEYPAIASSELLAALAVPPAREVPGVRLTLQPDFDVTPENNPEGPDAIILGDVLDVTRHPAGPLAITRGSLNRHTFVTGATGSGKSQTTRHLLESAAAAGIPWLVIEPAKAEYRLMAARLPDTKVITIRPGDPDNVAAGINPLEPATGPDGTRFPLQAHADLVRALFLAAFQAEEPFPQVLAQALTRCYKEAGWDLVSGEPAVDGAGFPDLGDLQAAALQVVNDIGYGQEVRDNIRGFVSVRIGSLQGGTTGRFLSGQFPIDYGKLLSGNVVFEVEDAGDDQDKAFMIGAILVKLTEFLRLRSRAEGPGAARLRHLTVIEEAHRLLRQPPEGSGAGAAAKAVEMFADLLAEIRAYGEGIIIAEQIPSKLIPDAIKNTAVKVVHRLPAQDDRDATGATMNLSPAQSSFLVTLKPGEAAVFTDGMDNPVLAKLPDGSARENTGRARPASPDGLVTGSRPACPPECADRVCTLRKVSAAARTAAEDSRITLWAELTVAAHLAGWLMPLPGTALASGLNGMDRRHRDCALATAVGSAVAARIPVLSARIPGPGLAAHAAASMRALLDGERCPCDGENGLRWKAPAYLWGTILNDLQEHERAHPGTGRHPSSAEWEAGTGQQIPGATCAQQIAVVQQRSADARRDPAAVTTVLYGNRQPSAIENAAGCSRGDPAWHGMVTTALTSLDRGGWLLSRYTSPGTRP